MQIVQLLKIHENHPIVSASIILDVIATHANIIGTSLHINKFILVNNVIAFQSDKRDL